MIIDAIGSEEIPRDFKKRIRHLLYFHPARGTKHFSCAYVITPKYKTKRTQKEKEKVTEEKERRERKTGYKTFFFSIDSQVVRRKGNDRSKKRKNRRELR